MSLYSAMVKYLKEKVPNNVYTKTFKSAVITIGLNAKNEVIIQRKATILRKVGQTHQVLMGHNRDDFYKWARSFDGSNGAVYQTIKEIVDKMQSDEEQLTQGDNHGESLS